MPTVGESRQRAEFGDFQTPPNLASEVMARLSSDGILPRSVLEPTCGRGNLLIEALRKFRSVERAVGLDIQQDHCDALTQRLATEKTDAEVETICGDFFSTDWGAILGRLPDPVLIVGNPPWVTNSALAAFGGMNLPRKSNFQRRRGVDAVTGMSNFDISEAILLRLLDALNGRKAVLAMLCKAAVARKVLMHVWKAEVGVSRVAIRRIDAALHFGASVDACLFQLWFRPRGRCDECEVFASLAAGTPVQRIGSADGLLIADMPAYRRWRHLIGRGAYRWRSGIKHDCSAVMEVASVGRHFVNGLGERVDVEPEYLYPMLKASDVAGEDDAQPRRWMVVPQRAPNEDTERLRHDAPRLWKYLEAHSDQFDARKSAIYHGRARFAIFGVGPYSFAPCKVAIAALYKTSRFRVVSPYRGRPVVFDDTCYFVDCGSLEEAECIASLLNSGPAQEFYRSLVFWDAKRPLTAHLLGHLNLDAVAAELDKGEEYRSYVSRRSRVPQKTLWG